MIAANAEDQYVIAGDLLLEDLHKHIKIESQSKNMNRAQFECIRDQFCKEFGKLLGILK